ncbi:FACT complex subunit SSRP1, putative [Plasmodium sp. gorilla clade G3]|nr:FACT complex subunit SSRP1, putative [Plasmodium sp. gorilla clade G3]
MGDNNASSGSSPVLSVGNIRGFGGSDFGSFRMSNEFLGWKNKKTNNVYQYKCSDIDEGCWIKTSYNNNRLHLKLGESKENIIIYFDGFPDRNVSEITQHFQKYFNIRLNNRKIATKGWNWGEFKLENSNLCFDIDNKYAFNLPTNNINQLNVQIKTDIAMEFKNEENSNKGNEDFLAEIRFYYPHENDENQNFQNLKNDLLEKVNIGDTKSESIASLSNIPLLVPRGRYDIEMYSSTFKLHGKSYDFNIQYTNINKMILVPKSNSNQYVLIFSLSNKMKQGQTEYPFILIQLNNDDDMELDISASDEVMTKYKLEKTISGKAHDVVTKLFTALVNKNVIVPGDYRTSKNQHGITCSYRAASGQLYPLNKYFLFIVKPVILISFDDIVTLSFQRTGNINQHRFFSLIIKHKRGMSYEYTNIDKSEYNPLLTFLKSKNINIQDDANDLEKKADFHNELDESDEEEYVADDDDDEEDYVAEEEDEDDDGDDDDDDEEEEEEEEEEDDDK